MTRHSFASSHSISWSGQRSRQSRYKHGLYIVIPKSNDALLIQSREDGTAVISMKDEQSSVSGMITYRTDAYIRPAEHLPCLLKALVSSTMMTLFELELSKHEDIKLAKSIRIHSRYICCKFLHKLVQTLTLNF